jgi:hypothetical protein
MRPDATSDFINACASSNVRPAIFVAADFVDGTVYLWSGLGPIVWNGHTWTGIGSLGSVSTIEEGANVQARGATLTLSGLDPALLAEVMTQYKVTAPVTIWLGLRDTSGAIIADPVISFRGRMDQPTLTVNGPSGTLNIQCESRLLDMNISVESRYTDQDQKLTYPDDRGMEWVCAIQDITLFWGRHPTASNNFSVQGTS